ncbi:MAG: hypothetical protein JWO94_3769 [Verrucomicrobiaceae bacterium]|nr:hypothetical protein [Verrucomicrobiaceae bacterium]
MNVQELEAALNLQPDADVRFILPDGGMIPAHAHVTEVGRVDKRFIDCGGTRRSDSHCLLQTWVANDEHHRLNAGKLAGIISKGKELLGDELLPVQIEYEEELVSQFPLAHASLEDGVIYLHTGMRHTDCLAKELCTPEMGCC